MDQILIPQPDAIPVAWGWFQFLLLLTFPLHLLAMNAMLGGLLLGIYQHLKGGSLEKQLAHRIAIALPLVIAFVVNFGVAPLLFLQVLYGQFVYSSSILMGLFWIAIVPILIVAYYGAYLYDFRFRSLGAFGIVIAFIVLVLLLTIGFFFSNNMLLMALPEQFATYFSNKSGTMLATDQAEFWPRYLHMMVGAIAIGGLLVGLLGHYKRSSHSELAFHSERLGMQVFKYFTLVNLAVGSWYLLSLPRDLMMLFMGKNLIATFLFIFALLLMVGALVAAFRKKYILTLSHAVGLVFLMSFMRSYLRSGYLAEYFTPEQLTVVPQYSPLIFFVVTFIVGIACIYWLLKKTYEAMAA